MLPCVHASPDGECVWLCAAWSSWWWCVTSWVWSWALWVWNPKRTPQSAPARPIAVAPSSWCECWSWSFQTVSPRELFFWSLTRMWLQGCRFQLPLLLAVHDYCAAAVPAGRERLHSALSALEQWTTAKGSNAETYTCAGLYLRASEYKYATAAVFSNFVLIFLPLLSSVHWYCRLRIWVRSSFGIENQHQYLWGLWVCAANPPLTQGQMHTHSFVSFALLWHPSYTCPEFFSITILFNVSLFFVGKAL